MSMQSFFNAISDAAKNTRSNYHLTLGELISALEKVDPNLRAVDRDTAKGVCNPHSYRGYYSDLSLEPSDEIKTVKHLLDELNSVFGHTLTGYKGGEFLMDDDTPLWISHYASSSNKAIIAVEIQRDVLYLITKDIK